MCVCVCVKVTEGTVPPAFTLKDQNGRAVSLSKFKGKPTIVYFYPADETPGCTKQVISFIFLFLIMLLFLTYDIITASIVF